MGERVRTTTVFGLGLGLALALGACSDDGRSTSATTFTTTFTATGTGDGDPDPTLGDGDPDPTLGDGDPTGDGDPQPLPCDPDFAFTPEAPGTGSLLNVAFTDPQPLAYVDLQASGPGVAAMQFAGISTTDPWTWNWTVTDLSPGVWTFSFGAGEDWMVLATCQIEVQDTGLPQPLPTGACEGKVCGDDDGMGSLCQTCPMVGDCLEPPSPYGPNGMQQWSCLDSASCQENDGTCRIWCPGEPCNDAEHPDGCPQGVETCWVDATITSYEEACKACCESRYHQPTGEYACWDETYNLCRYPTDCGLPLW